MRDEQQIRDKKEKIFKAWLTTEDFIYKLYLRGILDCFGWILEEEEGLVEDAV